MPWVTHQDIDPGDLGEFTVMRDKSSSTDVQGRCQLDRVRQLQSVLGTKLRGQCRNRG